MSHKGWQLDLVLMLGFGTGLYAFFKGFRVYREYRILEDTPEVPIRSIAMGLVHIRGTATGELTLASPVTHSPCYYYKVDIERWESNPKQGRGWHHYATRRNGVRFSLEDATGRVLVEPSGAEFDLFQSARVEIGNRGLSLWRLLGGRGDATPAAGVEVSEAELADYVATGGLGGPTALSSLPGDLPDGLRAQLSGAIAESVALLGRASTASGMRRFRLTEYCILAGCSYNVTGTCIENPNPKDERDRNLIVKGEDESTFLVSAREEKEIEKRLRWRALLYILGGGALAIVCLYAFIVVATLGWA